MAHRYDVIIERKSGWGTPDFADSGYFPYDSCRFRTNAAARRFIIEEASARRFVYHLGFQVNERGGTVIGPYRYTIFRRY